MRLLLDCDGILADFHAMYLDVVHLFTEIRLNHDELVQWDILDLIGKIQHKDEIQNHIEKNKLCSEIPVLPGAVEAVQKIQKFMDVVIVTAPMSTMTWCGERILWLKKYFQIPTSKIILTSSKHYIDGDFFVDDSLDNCKKWADHNDGITILWDKPWNRTGRKNMVDINIVKNWEDVFDILGTK